MLLSIFAITSVLAVTHTNKKPVNTNEVAAEFVARHGPQASGWGPAGVKQLSGYVTVDQTYKNGSHMFYWFFESQSNPSTDPFLIWLTGGPGCSAELALFFENGPYFLNNVTNKVELNPWSWNKRANLLYVDNPVGTGFSYADYTQDMVTDEKQVAAQMLTFLTEFMQMYPQYAGLNMSLFGESYGGHYVPAIANAVVQYNANQPAVPLNLQSIGIGNGWVDPYHQYPGYYEFAKVNNFVSSAEEAVLEGLDDACQGLIDAGLYSLAFVECNVYMQAVVSAISADVGYDINVYDVRIPCNGALCYNFDAITALMNTASVQRALGVAPQASQWQVCDNTVHAMLQGDWLSNLALDLPAVLAAGIKVLVYSGTEDFICNYRGGLDWSTALQWPGQQAYVGASAKPWYVNGTLAGSSKTASGASGTLIFLQVLNAGHMVPHDQPAAAYNLLEHMLDNKPF